MKLVACVAGRTSQQWTMSGVLPGDYAHSYEVRDHRNWCLTALTPVGTGGRITLAPCDGSAAQKWNGVGPGSQSQLGEVGED